MNLMECSWESLEGQCVHSGTATAYNVQTIVWSRLIRSSLVIPLNRTFNKNCLNFFKKILCTKSSSGSLRGSCCDNVKYLPRIYNMRHLSSWQNSCSRICFCHSQPTGRLFDPITNTTNAATPKTAFNLVNSTNEPAITETMQSEHRDDLISAFEVEFQTLSPFPFPDIPWRTA